MKIWSNQPTGSYKKVGAKILLLVVIALYSSPCARSEKRPRNEVSFHLPGNICFFALMGRKHDAEVEFTCCHSQKSAKVGFSKGFLSDLIRPDHVVDIQYHPRPAGVAGVSSWPLPRWNHGDFVRNSVYVRGRGVMTKTSIKGVIPFVPKKRRRTRSCGRRNLRLFFFRRVERRVSKYCSTSMDTVCTTPSRKLTRTD